MFSTGSPYCLSSLKTADEISAEYKNNSNFFQKALHDNSQEAPYFMQVRAFVRVPVFVSFSSLIESKNILIIFCVFDFAISYIS